MFLWGIAEGIYGILQILRILPSHNTFFAMTGHFDNPGPYGGFIACIVAVAVMFQFNNKGKICDSFTDRLLNVSSIASIIIGVIVLLASMSRSAWIGLSVALFSMLLSYRKVQLWIQRNRLNTAFIGFLFTLMLTGMFLCKQDSAIGRFHIWHMDLLALMNAPLNGYGKGYEMGAYGKAQASYFHTHLDNGNVSEKIIQIAGCPEYPFNEYLGIGLAYGVPVMLIVIILTIITLANLWLRGSPMAAGLTTLAVFAVGSYPMSIWQFWVLLAFFVTDCNNKENTGSPLRKIRGAMTPIISILLVLFIGIGSMRQMNYLKNNGFRTIYSDAYYFHLGGEWERSNELLMIGAKMSSDPMFHIIMGKNYEAMNEYDKAENEYWTARYMVPCRIYPLARLMRLKIKKGLIIEALNISELIAKMPVNNRLTTMIELKSECMKTRDSILIVLGRQ